MSADDAIVKIASYTKLKPSDIDDLKKASEEDPAGFADVMQDYIDMGAVDDRGVWVRIGQDLQAAAPYLGLAGAIMGVVGPLWGLLKG